jgi:PAS domain S-box-containing protein
MIDQHKQAFREETREILLELDSALREMDENSTSSETVARVFRTLHKLKVSAEAFGFHDISKFTHQLENAFGRAQNGGLRVSTDLIGLARRASGQIKAMVNEASGEGTADLRTAEQIPDKLNILLGEPEAVLSALERSEQKFRRILANMAEVFWTSNREGRTTYVSPKVETVLGYTKQEICTSGNALRMGLVHPDDFGRIKQSYRELFDSQRPFNEEYRVRRKDGAWIWIHDRASTTYFEKRNWYADGCFSDISRRKQEDAELRWKTAFLEAQTNATIDGVLVVGGDGRVLLRNRRFVEMFNFPAEILNQPDDRAMLQYAVTVLMPDPESFLAKVEWLNRHPEETSREEIELKNGMVIDRYSAPVFSKEGDEYYGRMWVFRDITERKRAERELELTRFSLENASDAIEWLDPNGRFIFVNKATCRDLGYSRDEFRTLSISDINPPYKEEAWAEFWNEVKSKGSTTLETQHKSKDGRLFPVEVTANYVVFGGQELCFAFARDITERRELEKQLRQAHKLEGIGQLAAGIAHEINTPTQFIADNLTFLRDSWRSAQTLTEAYRSGVQKAAGSIPPDIIAGLDAAEAKCDSAFIFDEAPRAIEQSLDGAGRVAKIVRAMKEFSHPDSAEKTLTDLNKAIESTITVARHEWKYVAEVVTKFEENLPPVLCYPGDINQVVLNLLVNSAHAIQDKAKKGGNDEKGRIAIRTRLQGEFVEISVTDTGTGIPEEIRGKIFDPFFTTKEVGRGTGQGLSLAHTMIAKKHNGKIWFETQAGQGSTFFIHLPVNPVSTAERTHAQAAALR